MSNHSTVTHTSSMPIDNSMCHIREESSKNKRCSWTCSGSVTSTSPQISHILRMETGSKLFSFRLKRFSSNSLLQCNGRIISLRVTGLSTQIQCFSSSKLAKCLLNYRRHSLELSANSKQLRSRVMYRMKWKNPCE
jgi:hypothetical protein